MSSSWIAQEFQARLGNTPGRCLLNKRVGVGDMAPVKSATILTG